MSKKNKLEPARDIQRVSIELLTPDKDNVRRNYDEAKLNELAESLISLGQLQNLECGPDGVVHMGNRRLKAIKEIAVPKLRDLIEETEPLAASDIGSAEMWAEKLAEYRVALEGLSNPEVRVLSVEAAKEAKWNQIVENLQREDVSAYDEALGFDQLLKLTGDDGKPRYSPADLGAKIGRSAEYIRSRTRLKKAPRVLLQALAAGTIGPRVCQLVCRVPRKDDREEAAKRVLKPQYKDRPLTEKETSEMIAADYMIKLAGCYFDTADADLVPTAGPCESCEFRSGNDPDLAGQLASGGAERKGGIDANLCTSPGCFRDKTSAAWQKTVDSAGGKYDVLPEEEAAKIFSQYGYMDSDDFVDLSDKPGYRDIGHYDSDKVQKWSGLLKGLEVKITKARNPHNGKVVDLVRRDLAKTAIEVAAAKRGEESIFAKQSGEVAGRSKEQEKAARERKLEERTKLAVFDRLADALSPEIPRPTQHLNAEQLGVADEFVALNHLSREALLAMLRHELRMGEGALEWFQKWLDLPEVELKDHDWGAKACEEVGQCMALIEGRSPAYGFRDLCSLLALVQVAGEISWCHLDDFPLLQSLCESCGLDIASVRDNVRAVMRDEEAAAKKKAAAKKSAKKATKKAVKKTAAKKVAKKTA